MPPAISKKRARAPRERKIAEGGCFYPGEAVRIAGIAGLNYRQLRQLVRIVKGEEQQASRWSRFSFRDIVALKVAYKLAKGKKTNHKLTRLHFAEVERACAILRASYGIADPLTEVQLIWEGSSIVAQLEGVHFEAASGQLLLVAEQLTRKASTVDWLRAKETVALGKQVRAEFRGLDQRYRSVPKSCVAFPLVAKVKLRAP